MTKKKLINLVDQLSEKVFDVEGELNEKLASDCILLLSKLPTSEAVFTLGRFKRQINKKIKEKTMIIESAIPLSSEDLIKVVKSLQQSYSFQDVKNVVDPAILAGVRIRIGDNLIDYSVSKRIEMIGDVIRG